MEGPIGYVIVAVVGYWLGYLTKHEKIVNNPVESIKNFANLQQVAKKNVKKLRPKVNDDQTLALKEREI